MNEKVYSLINEQIEKELYSAYLYLDMSNYYSDKGLDGFANWFYIQAQEEVDHAMLFRTYLLNNDRAVKLLPLDAPQEKYSAFDQPLNKSLEHEKFVTSLIDKIYDAASEEKDFRTVEFLSWFIKEQGEEEKNASDLISKFSLFGNDAKGLYQLDQELGTRVYAPPSLTLD